MAPQGGVLPFGVSLVTHSGPQKVAAQNLEVPEVNRPLPGLTLVQPVTTFKVCATGLSPGPDIVYMHIYAYIHTCICIYIDTYTNMREPVVFTLQTNSDTETTLAACPKKDAPQMDVSWLLLPVLCSIEHVVLQQRRVLVGSALFPSECLGHAQCVLGLVIRTVR